MKVIDKAAQPGCCQSLAAGCRVEPIGDPRGRMAPLNGGCHDIANRNPSSVRSLSLWRIGLRGRGCFHDRKGDDRSLVLGCADIFYPCLSSGERAIVGHVAEKICICATIDLDECFRIIVSPASEEINHCHSLPSTCVDVPRGDFSSGAHQAGNLPYEALEAGNLPGGENPVTRLLSAPKGCRKFGQSRKGGSMAERLPRCQATPGDTDGDVELSGSRHRTAAPPLWVGAAV